MLDSEEVPRPTLIYTDCIDFAHAFGMSYRQWKSADVCSINFYWISRFLFESLHFFANRFDETRFKGKPLLHALKSLFRFDALAPTIKSDV